MTFISLAVVITLLIRVRLVDKLVLVVSFGTCESLSILIHTYHLFNHTAPRQGAHFTDLSSPFLGGTVLCKSLEPPRFLYILQEKQKQAQQLLKHGNTTNQMLFTCYCIVDSNLMVLFMCS